MSQRETIVSVHELKSPSQNCKFSNVGEFSISPPHRWRETLCRWWRKTLLQRDVAARKDGHLPFAAPARGDKGSKGSKGGGAARSCTLPAACCVLLAVCCVLRAACCVLMLCAVCCVQFLAEESQLTKITLNPIVIVESLVNSNPAHVALALQSHS